MAKKKEGKSRKRIQPKGADINGAAEIVMKKDADNKLKKNENLQKKPKKIKNKVYEKELAKLQVELVKLQEWIKDQGLKVVVIFEGRDAAGKGGVIKRITQRLNPRVVRVVALGTPT